MENEMSTADKLKKLEIYKAKQGILMNNDLEIGAIKEVNGDTIIKVVNYNGDGGRDSIVAIPDFVDSIADINFKYALLRIPKGKTCLLDNLNVKPNYEMIKRWVRANKVRINLDIMRNMNDKGLQGKEIIAVGAYLVADGHEVEELLNKPYIGNTYILNEQTQDISISPSNRAIVSYRAMCDVLGIEFNDLSRMEVYKLNQMVDEGEHYILDMLLKRTDWWKERQGK